MCNAEVRGGYIGSTRLEYRPGPLNKYKKEYVADTKTAGCICLLAQIALPCALFLPCDNTVTLTLKGGTNVPMGPHIEYLFKVFQPMLRRFGADFRYEVWSRYMHSNLVWISSLYIDCIPIFTVNNENL